MNQDFMVRQRVMKSNGYCFGIKPGFHNSCIAYQGLNPEHDKQELNFRYENRLLFHSGIGLFFPSDFEMNVMRLL